MSSKVRRQTSVSNQIWIQAWVQGANNGWPSWAHMIDVVAAVEAMRQGMLPTLPSAGQRTLGGQRAVPLRRPVGDQRVVP